VIIVTGSAGTSEYEAALAIKSALTKLWPGCENSSAEEELIRIASNVRIAGYRVSDVDILVVGQLRPGRAFVPRRVVRDHKSARIVGAIQVINFAVVIEVKDHDPSRVQIAGDAIKVKYTGGAIPKWSDAVHQNVEQAHAIKTYFEHQHIDLFVRRAVMMRGFDKTPCSGALARNFDGAAFFTAVAETSPISHSGKVAAMRSASPANLAKALTASVFRAVMPTSLDRRRMDQIITRSADISDYLSLLGTKMLRFRGRGGTGKTVLLLQLAWRAFEEKAARSVVLTYNHALASDIRRLMALMNVPSSPEEGGIAVRTVMSFVTSWLARLGVAPVSQEGTGDYDRQCQEALEMLRGGALTSNDLEAIKLEDPDLFAFDYIVADEAQDWPFPEIELIKYIYHPEHLCLADGVDQLVRGRASDWEIGVPDNRRVTIPLKHCRRMKANLAIFANALAEQANVNWRVEPNREAGGGRIMLALGSMGKHELLVNALLEDARRTGNEAIDLLLCVPPRDVLESAGGERFSQTARALNGWGYEVWDGTDEDRRRDFPRSEAAFRVVQYASCRGLEGWSVMLEGFDEYWSLLCKKQYIEDNSASAAAISAAAWRHCLIPLSRAIDTLVIALSDPRSEPARLLLEMAKKFPDIFEIVDAA
jgi:hypothetical protein